MPLAAHSDFDSAFGFVVVSIVALILLLIAFAKVREFFFPRQIANRLRRFFGRHDYSRLEAHEKSFPGYDLPSVHRALAAFFSEKCTSNVTVGACPYINSFQDLLNAEPNAYVRRLKPTGPSYVRLPVDVDEEDSFVTHCIYFATLPPPPAGPAPKLAVMLAHQKVDHPRDEGLESNSAPTSLLKVSVACTDRALAARFFNELESSRKRLSIYRGKVIDPNVTPAGIQSIAFRRIQRVGPEDLVLPDAVRSLVDGSIVAFYRNRDALSSLGVELKRGVLFNSPPGTGKTSISLFLASFLPDFTVCFVSGRKLLFPREVCEMARYLQPTMLVFEDIDLIAQDRDVNGLATVLGELMNQIDGCEPNDQVLFIMNTNSMDRIEQAVRNRPGRVDQIIDIPLPDIDARRSLIRYFSRNLTLWPEDIDRLASATDGVTPAELKEVVKRAAVLAVSRTHSTPPPPTAPPSNSPAPTSSSPSTKPAPSGPDLRAREKRAVLCGSVRFLANWAIYILVENRCSWDKRQLFSNLRIRQVTVRVRLVAVKEKVDIVWIWCGIGVWKPSRSHLTLMSNNPLALSGPLAQDTVVLPEFGPRPPGWLARRESPPLNRHAQGSPPIYPTAKAYYCKICDGGRRSAGVPSPHRVYGQEISAISTNFRHNEQIRISPIRLVNDKEEQVGIVTTSEALRMAREAGLDLVEVAPQARPPVCRIMDYGKWRYQQQKKEDRSRASSRAGQLKELKFRTVKIGEHDLLIKVNHARDFLKEGNKVQFTLQFRGRELAHIDLGRDIFKKIKEELFLVSKVERDAKMEGKRMTMVLQPDHKAPGTLPPNQGGKAPAGGPGPGPGPRTGDRLNIPARPAPTPAPAGAGPTAPSPRPTPAPAPAR